MRAALILIFAVSGFAGLVYESVWSHYLRILVGAAAYAQSLVLAVFMGGMALGAWWASRKSPQWGNLLRAYAMVEGLLGLLAPLFHPVFVGVEGVLFGDAFAGAVSPGVATAVRWAAATLLVLPQSILLGMTFPLMAAAYIRRFPARPGAALSVLYFANALGGAAGVLVGGFALIRWVGLPGTVLAAGVLNLLLAGVVWWGFVRGRAAEPESLPPSGGPAQRVGAPERSLLLVAGGAGLASFVYEVVWIRMLSLVLSSSAHAFELMLSAFILGIALGGLWIRGRVDALVRPLRFLGAIQLAMGVLAVATLPLYARLFPLMQTLLEALPPTPAGYLRFNLASHGMALAVMLPATLCAGATLPLLTHVLLRGGFGERSIGRAYGVNTVGAVAGALLTVHLAMPALGLKGTLAVGAGVNLILGAYLLSRAAEAAPRRSASGWAAVAGVLATAAVASTSLDPAVLSSGVYRRYVDLEQAHRATVLEHTDGKTASVSLVRDERGVLSIRTNGKPSASVADADTLDATGDETVSTLLGALPLVLHPGARDAVNIGMGSGITSQVLLSSPALRSVTTVEIESAMVRLAAGFAPRNERVFSDPRSRVVVQDARAFFSAPDSFDIVVTQPFNPWISGAGTLYSTEFYAVLRSRLRPGGLLVQWIQLNETDLPLVASTLRAIAEHFPRMRLYAGATGDVIVVASPDRLVPDLDGGAFRQAGLLRELERVDVRTIQDLGMRTAGDERTVAALLELVPSPANSEFRPYVEERGARARFTEAGAEEVLNLMVQPLPIMELLGILTPPWTHSEATPAMAFFYSTRPVGAVAFRDLVLLGQEPSREGNPFERRARDEALRLQHDCAYQGFGEDALPAFYGVAATIVTDLRPAELDAVWQGLESWSCVRDLVGGQRRWLDFFQAVGQRDAASIAALAPELLTVPDILTPARARYLVASGMVAHIALGRAGDALDLWDRHRAGLFEDGEPTFLFLHLEALAEGRTGM